MRYSIRSQNCLQVSRASMVSRGAGDECHHFLSADIEGVEPIARGVARDAAR